MTPDLNNFKTNDKILAKCDMCGQEKLRRKRDILKTQKNFNMDLCHSCSARESTRKKPQCSPEYWNVEKKSELGIKIKTSQKYQDAIPGRKLFGEKNGMYGKGHSVEAKKKMSISRMGKLGPNATAWKGGKKSLIQRLKGLLQIRYKWFHKIIDRDKKCTECGTIKKLDAHHIISVAKLVKIHLNGKIFDSDEDKLLFLLTVPDIIDVDLKNGITLCRLCHKKANGNWGSHNG